MATVSISEYEKVLNSLIEAIEYLQNQADDVAKKIARDACIQRFEFSVELGWKVSKKTMGSSSTAPKTIVREMAQNSLIDDPTYWFAFLEARNKSSHTYDEQVAEEVLQVAIEFVDFGRKLLSKLGGFHMFF